MGRLMDCNAPERISLSLMLKALVVVFKLPGRRGWTMAFANGVRAYFQLSKWGERLQ